VGFVAFKLVENSATFYHRVLQEYEGETWADGYLNLLIETVAKMLQQAHYVSSDGWLN
jgi:hypothetical protein